MSNSYFFKSSLAKKYWMALTGLFLCSFLLIHLLGNLLLIPIIGDQDTFNEYAKFMTTFPVIKIVSYLLYFSILFHAVDGLMLVAQNRAARKQKYAYNKPGANSIWASRNMGLLGTIVLAFIVTHMGQFWYKMHWGDLSTYTTEENKVEVKDLWTVVYKTFEDDSMGLVFTILYVLSMAAMGFHLYHGFQSAFQTLGIRHPKYTPIIKMTGYLFSIVIPLLFAIIPVYIFLAK